MIRLLIFLLWVVFAAFAATLLLSMGETVKVEAFGWRMDAPAGVAGAAIALLLGVTALVVSLVKDLTAMRRRSLLRAVLKRRDKGVLLLVEAAEAHRGENFAKAEKLAAKAARLLDRDAVAGFFKAPAPPAAVEIEIPAPAPEPRPEIEREPEPDPAPAAAEAAPLLPPPTVETPALPPPPDVAAAFPDADDVDAAADRAVAAARRVN